VVFSLYLPINSETAMTDNRPTERTRNPERSREAILHAAEQLFAERGYENTSLQDVGAAAGVSRGTPAYFFGSKEQLYRAVLDRVLESDRALVDGLRAQLTQPENTIETVVAAVVGGVIDFLLARPTFLLLIEREARSGSRFLGSTPALLTVLSDSLGLINDERFRSHTRPIDPTQLLLSIVALCWFPLDHATTFMQPLGIDPLDPAFVAQRKQHVTELILRGILAP
jgi:TetR/AcrR family transcriptional regulator